MCYSIFGSVCSSTQPEGERKKGGRRETAGVDSLPKSGAGIKPKQFTDKNVTCSEASAFAGLDAYSYSTGQLSTMPSDGSTTEILGKYYLTMTFDSEDEPSTISWQSTFPDCYCFKDLAVILSDGEVSNVYYYKGTTIPKFDSGLGLKVGDELVQPTLITFCYNFYRCKEDDGGSTGGTDTAFVGNVQGNGNNQRITAQNPAWYYYVNTNVGGPKYDIYAGNSSGNKVEGAYAKITITKINTTITIEKGSSNLTLVGDACLKVQGYATVPPGRPIQYDYTSDTDTITVPNAAYYVIHLTVAK